MSAGPSVMTGKNRPRHLQDDVITRCLLFSRELNHFGGSLGGPYCIDSTSECVAQWDLQGPSLWQVGKTTHPPRAPPSPEDDGTQATKATKYHQEKRNRTGMFLLDSLERRRQRTKQAWKNSSASQSWVRGPAQQGQLIPFRTSPTEEAVPCTLTALVDSPEELLSPGDEEAELDRGVAATCMRTQGFAISPELCTACQKEETVRDEEQLPFHRSLCELVLSSLFKSLQPQPCCCFHPELTPLGQRDED
ncbi:hypothetical protein P7K49_009033 [Saguinus oedipus]|uniref:Uncharacterized protein n=1 Tax=Saguinus oedipus TaxID=9490 RepID=A0ABQ9VZE7_SAGOE|nr:hypothetical protein P7K49_009033 [Saguinus oedipus]